MNAYIQVSQRSGSRVRESATVLQAGSLHLDGFGWMACLCLQLLILSPQAGKPQLVYLGSRAKAQTTVSRGWDLTLHGFCHIRWLEHITRPAQSHRLGQKLAPLERRRSSLHAKGMLMVWGRKECAQGSNPQHVSKVSCDEFIRRI